uniref:Protein angel 2 n=1 Tax=Aceria tosichella TaxID=561515 RepID=A0A6G1SJV1_9ACAR
MVSRNLRFRFTLVSYNILSQSLLNDHNYLYNNCNPHDLEWPRRGHRILKELINNRADIICLQEVESDHLQSLYRPKLARYGYECLYKKKTGYKLDGCAIFYKSKLFHLSNSKGVEFNRTDVAYLLNRDNVGLIAVLKPRIPTRSESSHLVIANTHLIFNPRRCDVRLAQLKYFLSELEAISRNFCDSNKTTTNSATNNSTSIDNMGQPSYHPTILCGDLNSTPDSEVIRCILKNTRLLSSNNARSDESIEDDGGACDDDIGVRSTANDRESSSPTIVGKIIANHSQPVNTCHQQNTPISAVDEELARARLEDDNNSESEGNNLTNFEHSLEFKSVYPTHNSVNERYVSTFSSDIVDYIFYTPKLRLESFKELLTEQQLDDIGPLPNSKFPSDHITLGAKFTLK